jgi:hypothetical protein
MWIISWVQKLRGIMNLRRMCPAAIMLWIIISSIQKYKSMIIGQLQSYITIILSASSHSFRTTQGYYNGLCAFSREKCRESTDVNSKDKSV